MTFNQAYAKVISVSTPYPASQNLAPQAEIENSHEMFVGLLTGIANHEAKLATTAIIASQPDVWFSETSLWNEVRLRQGDNPGWIPDRRGPAKYCSASLGPIGLVTKGTTRGERGNVAAYKANEDQPDAVERGLALSGTLMEWSLEFPEVSLQKILGVTASAGAFRTPEVRYGILKELVDNIGGPMSYMDIARPLLSDDIDERNIFASIRELTDNNTVTTQLIDSAENVTLEITGPYEYRGSGLRLDQMTASGQLTYHAIDLLWELDQKVITFDDLATAALQIDSDAYLPGLRQYWHYGSNADLVNMPNFKPVERKMDAPSIVALSPVHSEAIKDLVQRLRTIENTQTDLQANIKAAKEIISNTNKMAKLYAKARRFSSNVTGQEEGTEIVDSQILNIVVNAGQITTKGVFEVMRSTGRPLTEERIRNYLSKLASAGALSQNRRKLDASKKREHIFYSIPDNDTK